MTRSRGYAARGFAAVDHTHNGACISDLDDSELVMKGMSTAITVRGGIFMTGGS